MLVTQDYVQHWLEHHALSRATPTLRKLAREWIDEAAEAREGFVDALRGVALTMLSHRDTVMVRRALVALATVARPDDLALVTPLCDSPDPGVSADAKATQFEIEHGAV